MLSPQIKQQVRDWHKEGVTYEAIALRINRSTCSVVNVLFPEARSRSSLRYYYKNRRKRIDHMKEYYKGYYKKNREKVNAYRRAYYHLNRDRILARDKTYRAKKK